MPDQRPYPAWLGHRGVQVFAVVLLAAGVYSLAVDVAEGAGLLQLLWRAVSIALFSWIVLATVRARRQHWA